METSIVFSFVAKLKTSPIDFVHKIPCGAPQSLEFPCGDFFCSFVFSFVLGLHKVPKVSTLCGRVYVHTVFEVSYTVWTSFVLRSTLGMSHKITGLFMV